MSPAVKPPNEKLYAPDPLVVVVEAAAPLIEMAMVFPEPILVTPSSVKTVPEIGVPKLQLILFKPSVEFDAVMTVALMLLLLLTSTKEIDLVPDGLILHCLSVRLTLEGSEETRVRRLPLTPWSVKVPPSAKVCKLAVPAWKVKVAGDVTVLVKL